MIDLGLRRLPTNLGVALLVALLLGVLIGGLAISASVVLPLRRRLRARRAPGRDSAAHFRSLIAWRSSASGSGSSCCCRSRRSAAGSIGRRGGERHSDTPGQPPVDHVLPRPELPAQRAAGQGDRAVPAHRRTRQGHVRDAGRARPPVPPPRRSRSRDPPAPGAGAAPRPERPAEACRHCSRWARTTCARACSIAPRPCSPTWSRIDMRAPLALRHLIGIYQSERDWDKAIENARRYEEATGEPMGKLIAQFECELAERHRAAGDIDAARAAVARAYEADANSRARRHDRRPHRSRCRQRRRARSARSSASRAQDPDYLPEILPPLLRLLRARRRRARRARVPGRDDASTTAASRRCWR